MILVLWQKLYPIIYTTLFMETTLKTPIALRQSSSPASPGKWYTEGELNNKILEAYRQFKASLTKHMKEEFEKNFTKAKQACEELYSSLKNELGIHCNKIHLRYLNLNVFDAIVELPQESYLSDHFDQAYLKSLTVTEQLNNQKFDMLFHFMPSSNKVNQKALVSDGFILTYKETNVKKTSTRIA